MSYLSAITSKCLRFWAVHPRDSLCLSQSYDHLDYDTIKSIADRKCGTTVYIVPLGVKKWMTTQCGLADSQVTELDWWEDRIFVPEQLPHAVVDREDQGAIRITCVPAQHASARTGVDASSTLWAGFVVEQLAGTGSDAPERVSVYFAGDTGYRGSPQGETCPAFKQIGERFGPIDFAAIPIWRGGTLSFISQWGVRVGKAWIARYMHNLTAISAESRVADAEYACNSERRGQHSPRCSQSV